MVQLFGIDNFKSIHKHCLVQQYLEKQHIVENNLNAFVINDVHLQI